MGQNEAEAKYRQASELYRAGKQPSLGAVFPGPSCSTGIFCSPRLRPELECAEFTRGPVRWSLVALRRCRHLAVLGKILKPINIYIYL